MAYARWVSPAHEGATDTTDNWCVRQSGDSNVDWEAFERYREQRRKEKEAYEAYAELDQSEDLNDDPRVRKLF